MATPPSKDARQGAAERIERGIASYGEGDLEGALRAFEEALTLVPGHERALRCLAWVRDLSDKQRQGATKRAVDDDALRLVSEALVDAEERPARELGESPWELQPLTPTGGELAASAGGEREREGPATLTRTPSLASVPRKTVSSSTMLGMPPLEPAVLSPQKLAAQMDERAGSGPHEFGTVVTSRNLPPLDVPELTDEQVAQLMKLESGLPRPGAVNDTAYLEMEIAPASHPRGSSHDTGVDAREVFRAQPLRTSDFDAPDTTPERALNLLGGPTSARGRSPDITPLPLEPVQGHDELAELPRFIPEEELPNLPTNPFISGKRMREYASFGAVSPAEPALQGDRLALAVAAIERGDMSAAVDAAERMIAEGGGMEAPAVRPHHATLEQVFQASIGPLDHVPVPSASSPALDPRAAFLLSRLDGTLTVEDLLDVSGMPRLEALRLLALLVHRGAVLMR